VKGDQRVLKITVPIGPELWDEEKEEFTHEGFDLELEHSLVTLFKWESIHRKPFLGTEEKTSEEVESYVRIMIQNPDYPPEILSLLSKENVEAIQAYIQDDHSATTFRADSLPKGDSETVTAELVYFWMNTLRISKEYENWHLNSLFTLIKIHSVKNSPEKKRSPAEMFAERKALNAKRRAELGHSG
jgi:hypothetical protein